MKYIDHEYTKNIVCPYCGYEDIDSFEVRPNDDELGLIECGNCNKSFYAVRIITVDYSTEKARYGVCKGCNKNLPIENYHSTLGTYKDLCVSCGYKEIRRLQDEYFKNLERTDK